MKRINISDIVDVCGGKSGHLELGYSLGKGKKGYILFDKEPARWDMIHQFATGIFYSTKDLITELKKIK